MDKGQLSTAYILYISNQLYTFDLVALTDNSRIGAFFPCAIIPSCDSIITLHSFSRVKPCQRPYLSFNPKALLFPLILLLSSVSVLCTLRVVPPLCGF